MNHHPIAEEQKPFIVCPRRMGGHEWRYDSQAHGFKCIITGCGFTSPI